MDIKSLLSSHKIEEKFVADNLTNSLKFNGLNKRGLTEYSSPKNMRPILPESRLQQRLLLCMLMETFVPDNPEHALDILKQQLSLLPAYLSATILGRLRQSIHYDPTIGMMGKCGAGKSSLCNALFTPPPARVSAVRGCTRHVQPYPFSLATHTLLIVDFPGIGETPVLDRVYARLYQRWLNKLDLIVWVLKADDRAWNDDIRCYRQLVSHGADPNRFIFVLNQADKI